MADSECSSDSKRISVIISTVLILAPIAGFINSFGIIIEELYNELCEDTDCMMMLGLIGALTLSSYRILMFLPALLSRFIHPSIIFIVGTVFSIGSLMTSSFASHLSQLLITHCLLFGFGSAFLLNTPLIAVDRLYPSRHRKHVITTSVLDVAPPIGTMVMTPLIVWLSIDCDYSWREIMRLIAMATLVVGGVYLAVMHQTFCMEERDIYEDLDVDDTTCKTKPHKPSIKEKSCDWMIGACHSGSWFIVLFFLSTALFIPKIMFMHYYVSIGIQLKTGAMFMSFSALSESLFAFFISGIGGFFEHHIMIAVLTGSFGLALLNLFMPWNHFQLGLGLYGLAHGAVDGLVMTVLFTVSAKIALHEKYQHYIWYASNAIVGFGQLSGLTLAGYLYDLYEYTYLFFLCAVVYAMACIISILLYACLMHNHEVRQYLRHGTPRTYGSLDEHGGRVTAPSTPAPSGLSTPKFDVPKTAKTSDEKKAGDVKGDKTKRKLGLLTLGRKREKQKSADKITASPVKADLECDTSKQEATNEGVAVQETGDSTSSGYDDMAEQEEQSHEGTGNDTSDNDKRGDKTTDQGDANPDSSDLVEAADDGDADQVISKGATADQEPVKDAKVGQEPVKDATADKEPVKDTTLGQEPAKDATPDKQPSNDATADQEPVKDGTTDQESAKDGTTDQEPVTDATADQEPVKDATADQEPVKDATADQEPAKDGRAGKEAPSKEATKDGTAEE